MKFEDIEKYYKRIDIISEANLINFYATRLARTKNFDEKNSLIRAVDIIKRRYDNFYEYVFISIRRIVQTISLARSLNILKLMRMSLISHALNLLRLY